MARNIIRSIRRAFRQWYVNLYYKKHPRPEGFIIPNETRKMLIYSASQQLIGCSYYETTPVYTPKLKFKHRLLTVVSVNKDSIVTAVDDLGVIYPILLDNLVMWHPKQLISFFEPVKESPKLKKL